MLTNDQITQVDNFCQKKGIRYYDLRMEVVDHLAASIEERMNCDSKLSFEEALTQVYKGFGITGFSKIIQERETSIRKAARRLEWKLFKEYFKLPQCIVSLIVLFLLNQFLLISTVPQKTLYIAYSVVLFTIGLGWFIYDLFLFSEPKKKLIQLRAINSFTFVGLLCQIPNIMFNVGKAVDIDIYHPAYKWFIAGFSLVMILICLAKHRAYRIIYNQAKKNYPLAFQ